jgi:peptidoglycan/LPS O-acetylase OafA/YrhL
VVLAAVVDTIVLGYRPDVVRVIANMSGLNGVLVPTLQSNEPLWSLAYEIWFYVIGGTAAAILSRRFGIGPLLLLSIGILVFSILDARYLLYWLLGSGIFLFRDNPHRLLMLWLGVSAAILGAALNQVGSDSRSFQNALIVPVSVSHGLICVGISLTLPALCDPQTTRRIQWLARPAAWLAGFSYSLYLFHYPVLVVLEQVLPKASELSIVSLFGFTLKSFACLAFAILMYHCFEKNTAAVRHQLQSLRRGGRAATAAP